MTMKKIKLTAILILMVLSVLPAAAGKQAQEQPQPQPQINDWENPEMFDRNKEAPHCPIIPYHDAQTAIKNDPAASPFYKSLNGTWKFYWVRVPRLRPKEFYKEVAAKICEFISNES